MTVPLPIPFQPEVMAKISDFVTYPNAVPSSYELIAEEVKGDPSLFPTAEVKQNLFTVTPYDQRIQRTGCAGSGS